MTKKHMPTMVAVMTPFPHSVHSSAPIAQAAKVMEALGVHHLPVIDDGDIVGMLSGRDLLKAVGLGESPCDKEDILVSDLINHRPYMVDVNDPVPNVLHAMAEKHIGSVIVLKDGDVAGIFTSNDALRHFAAFLEEAYPGEGDDEVA